jgi:hypothetical protein
MGRLDLRLSLFPDEVIERRPPPTGLARGVRAGQHRDWTAFAVWTEGWPAKAGALSHIEAGPASPLFVSKEENGVGNQTPEMGMTWLPRPNRNGSKPFSI